MSYHQYCIHCDYENFLKNDLEELERARVKACDIPDVIDLQDVYADMEWLWHMLQQEIHDMSNKVYDADYPGLGDYEARCIVKYHAMALVHLTKLARELR